jgi:hypothetical protein
MLEISIHIMPVAAFELNICPEQQVLLHRHGRKDLPALGNERAAAEHDLLRRNTVNVPAIENDFTRLGPEQARDGLEERGFTCAVCAEDRDNLAWFT